MPLSDYPKDLHSPFKCPDCPEPQPAFFNLGSYAKHRMMCHQTKKEKLKRGNTHGNRPHYQYLIDLINRSK